MHIITLSDKKVGEGQPIFVTCEAGVTNYGEFEIARRQIDAAVAAAADAIKFQWWKTERLVSRAVAKRLEPELGYNWFDRMKYKELSEDEMHRLQGYARDQGIAFYATPHDDESIAFLDQELGVPYFKVGSGESHNYGFLKKVGRCAKPVIISFGLQTEQEAIRAVETLRDAGAAGIIALHCVTKYPMKYHEVGLPRIARLRQILGVPVGISDHTVGWHVPLAAVALGAVAIEKHVTFDKADPRSLDNPGALLPEEFKVMVSQVRDLEKALADTSDEARKIFLATARDWAGQSVVARRVLAPGTVIAAGDLACKRPFRGGLPPEAIDVLIGKKVTREIPEDEQIQWGDVG